GPGTRGQGVRRHRRQQGDRPGDGDEAVRRGSPGALRVAQRGRGRRGRRGLPRRVARRGRHRTRCGRADHRHVRRADGRDRRARQQRRHVVRAPVGRADRRGLARPVGPARDGADAAHARRGTTDGGGRRRPDRERRVERRQAALADQRGLFGHQGRRALAQPGVRRLLREAERARQRGRPGSDGLAAVDGGGWSRRPDRGGRHARGGDRGPGGEGAARPIRLAGGGRRGDRVPRLGPVEHGHRSRVVGRRRHRRHDRL
ncbi:MAG: 3-oxoacyl-[acyl-carrier protein] reductase, partial [uncultured Solirubrobacteraceae bacterium]